MHAMILAAGRGERMRPLTDTTPKPLLEVGGKALIVWIIERLVRAGIEEIVINHAHLGAKIEAALGNGRRFGGRILYSREGTALETAGGIALALSRLGTMPFLVVNGDVYCDMDYRALVTHSEHSLAADTLAHLVLVPNPAHNPTGDFSIAPNGGLMNEGAPRHTFAGIALYRPSLFAGVPAGDRAKLAPLLRDAAANGQATAEILSERWVDVGTPERLAELDRLLRHENQP
ncbi:MAG: N-acetylmuramate alpha-1-phosphate uridylyltransferase MurU [Burkholderiales bacterium]